jgi:hypothetical protein
MQNKRKENVVRSLVGLYTVIIGVALSLSVATLIDPQKGLESLTPSSTLLFGAFLVTLFPFYQGALRHLDDAYIENDNPNIKDGALIVDFMLLFLHSLAFVLLALLLQRPANFAFVLTGVLLIDVVWGVFAHFGSSSKSENLTAESKWTILNFVFVAAAAWYLVANDISLNDSRDAIKLSVPIAIAAMLRTMADYIWCNAFYFPRQ